MYWCELHHIRHRELTEHKVNHGSRDGLLTERYGRGDRTSTSRGVRGILQRWKIAASTATSVLSGSSCSFSFLRSKNDAPPWDQV